jgi:hypothetical protein
MGRILIKRQKLTKLLLIFLIIIAGCKSYRSALIERDQIVRFDINEIYGDELDYLEISGLIGWSSYNYKKIDVIIDNNIMKILMYGELSILNKKGSGSFNITIPIEKNINNIIFGNDNVIIWERKSVEALKEREKILQLEKFTEYNDIVNRFGEPDAVIGSGFLIIQYTLNNNRKAILNFAGGGDGLLKLTELYGDKTKKIIFDFE